MFSDPSSASLPPGSFHESHTIETPEQTNLEFTVAGVGSRALALTIDTLIQAGIALVVLAVFTLTAGIWSALPLAGIWLSAILIMIVFLLYYGYFALFEIFWNGQTPGKRRVGLRVIKDTGRRLSAVETVARNLLRIVDQLPGFYAVGIVVSLLNKQNKRLGDLVVGSLVVRESSSSQPKPTWYEYANQSPEHAMLGGERLSDEDVILIESFLQRRYELAPDIRWRMANEVFRRIEHKLTFTADERPGVEHLLETALHERRAI
ncbi:MAG: RDD family protein [Acidobacteriaceae bacterium]|nr:RDD family protein [Acidobacteriaceae bacterium]